MPDVVKLIEEPSGLSITEFYRWLSFWWLDKKGILRLDIAPKEPTYLTDEELEVTPDQARHYRLKRKYFHERIQ